MRVGRRLVLIVAAVAAGLAILVAALLAESGARAAALPSLAAFSLGRMILAYLSSLIFAIAYGYTAATNRRAAIVMLPLLDVLQSVPILGFFPAALVFFVATFQGHPVGLELAVIFLIFTSMAWNMAFGVYESLTTIPRDLEDAASAFGLAGVDRFRLLLFPAAVPKLVYNSILSWTNGWFFLVASEIFTAFGQTYARPGLGAFIANAGVAGDVAGIALGLGVLATLVLAMDILFWRPLSLWAERFRVETTGREVPRVPGPYERFRWLPRLPRIRHAVVARAQPAIEAYHRGSARLERWYFAHPQVPRSVKRVDLAMFLVIFVIVVATGLVGLARLFLGPLPAEAGDLPMATALSFSRLALGYGLALAWTIPMAVWLGRSRWAARYITPTLEILASLPATALLPVILGFAILVTGATGRAAELAAVLIALFAMQWYLLFNLIAGVRSVPEDLRDAVRSLGVRGWTYWRRVLLPAIVPSLLTGSITAWGAGWNALIVSEYIPFGDRIYRVLGLGRLLDEATFTEPPNNEMILLTILTMILVVLAMNKLLWRPLQRKASDRFRLEV